MRLGLILLLLPTTAFCVEKPISDAVPAITSLIIPEAPSGRAQALILPDRTLLTSLPQLIIPGGNDVLAPAAIIVPAKRALNESEMSAENLPSHDDLEKLAASLAGSDAKRASGLTQDHIDKAFAALRLIDQNFDGELPAEKWNDLINKGLAAIDPTAVLRSPNRHAARPGGPALGVSEESGLTREILDKFSSTLRRIDESFVEKPAPWMWNGFIDKSLAAIVAGLDDPYAEYFDNELMAQLIHHMNGSGTGVGIKPDVSIAKMPLNVPEAGLRIKKTRKGSPARTAGLLSGDVIVRVDGEEIGGRPFNDFYQKVAGQSGTKVELTVLRDGALIDFSVTRVGREFPLLHSRMLAPEIGYLYYSRFRSESADDFMASLRELQAEGAKKVVIDLRGNYGGDRLATERIVAGLLPAGLETGSTRRRGKVVSRSQTERDGPFAQMEKVVLIDGRSASGSDMAAATLQDYGVPVLGPGNSHGKFTIQKTFRLGTGAGFRMTTARFYSGKGRHLPSRYYPGTVRNVPASGGVTPDVLVPMTEEQEEAVCDALEDRLYGEDPGPVADPVLDKAVEILGRKN